MVKVLVIEDEREVRHLINQLLSREGYVVVDAEHGRSGYHLAISKKPDVILLDLMMPGVSGFEVLGDLKSNPDTMEIPVIILTAKIDAESERRCMRFGAADYIKKPWGPGEIGDRIAMAIGYRATPSQR